MAPRRAPVGPHLLGAALVAAALVSPAAGCFKVDVASCTVACASDGDCPGGLTCSAEGRCSTGGSCAGGADAGAADAVTTCTPDEFLSCSDPSTAVRCNSTGDGAVTVACGAPGCSDLAAGCNLCEASSTRCVGDQLEQCAADGSGLGSVETCDLGCVDTATPARCATIAPVWLPGVCDVEAPAGVVTIAAGTYDTGLAATCTGGMVAQSGAAPICVVRGRNLDVPGTVIYTGPNPVALVADVNLVMGGNIDVSANGVDDGPGGGPSLIAAAFGTPASRASRGGSGSGFKTNGGLGGVGTGTAGTAGTFVNPLVLNAFLGGPGGSSPTMVNGGGFGGGGGGGLILVACRGVVTVNGSIDAGGGGGRPGYDETEGAQVSVLSAGGGGAGGYVVVQGARVVLGATSALWANGGGGGGGTHVNDGVGLAGEDGRRAAQAAPGGIGQVGGGTGGNGGSMMPPTAGGSDGQGSAGGGGGSAGRIQVYAPAPVATRVMSAVQAFSPTLEGFQPVPTR
ncbi:MAG: hypothetical protein KA297_20390 [Kofleriaceae bacterium]|nr:hypothetical protein [Kofleriaceae bacterium]MBP6841119.1 hypothetical protein [Kofleriaceae bacterium]